MKNVLLLLAAFLFIGMTTSSCKKSWTCECSTEDGSDSTSYTIEDIRRNDARSKCDEYADIWGQCQVLEIK